MQPMLPSELFSRLLSSSPWLGGRLSQGWKEVCPFPRVVGTEDMKICFDFLIGLFCLSISLEGMWWRV